MTTRTDSARAIRLIIAEDHAVVREGTRQLLEREEDLEVVGEAANGAEAVSLVATLAPDLVIMDISMPVMNGIEATQQIKAMRPSTAVLVLTAYDDDHYVSALLGAGAAGYLLKDVPAAELVHAIRAVYAGEAVLHPAIVKRVLARFAEGESQARGTAPGPRDQPLLTAREMEVLRLAASGMTNGQIADLLDCSVRTVQVHMTHLFGKLGVGSRTEAVVAGLRKGFLSLEDLGEG
ncbi:MAG: response regulator transcription factor [Dehalococcoidia bacterium]